MMSRRRTLTKPFYSNVIIVSRDGKLLSTISDHKAEWYLKKKLALEINPPQGYPRAIRLNFEPEPEQEPQTYSLNVSEDRCAICGNTNNLTLHHVIPYVIRKYLPLKHKTKSRQWCVLLCTLCHDKIERATQPLYRKDFPNAEPNRNTNHTLQMIKHTNTLHKVPPERMRFLLAYSDYKTIDNIPPYTPINKRLYFAERSSIHRKRIQNWAETFIAEHGGIEGIKAYFRSIFLSFNPKHLPQGYLEIGDTNLTDNRKVV